VRGGGAQDEHFLRTPTILAWDLGALCRILPFEADPGSDSRSLVPFASFVPPNGIIAEHKRVLLTPVPPARLEAFLRNKPP
jgi:hypothetical protein